MISFNIKDVEMPILNLAKIEIWLGEIASGFNRRIGNLNYIFCNDEEILRINREFLKHNYYTDIITFDYSLKDKISGDIFISIDTVKFNSKEQKVPYNSELLRVIIHGLLHLCGIKDKEPGEREIMESHENIALETWQKLSESSEI